MVSFEHQAGMVRVAPRENSKLVVRREKALRTTSRVGKVMNPHWERSW